MSQVVSQEFILLFCHELWAAAMAIRKFADLSKANAPAEKLQPAAWDAMRASYAALSGLVEKCDETVKVQLLLAPSNVFQTMVDSRKTKKKKPPTSQNMPGVAP